IAVVRVSMSILSIQLQRRPIRSPVNIIVLQSVPKETNDLVFAARSICPKVLIGLPCEGAAVTRLHGREHKPIHCASIARLCQNGQTAQTATQYYRETPKISVGAGRRLPSN